MLFIFFSLILLHSISNCSTDHATQPANEIPYLRQPLHVKKATLDTINLLPDSCVEKVIDLISAGLYDQTMLAKTAALLKRGDLSDKQRMNILTVKILFERSLSRPFERE